MEKQRMEETAMEENKKTNPDSERKSKLVSAILMAFVCVLMMGGGTYAWFTMGNTARVKSLQLNVASEGNLYISKNPITSDTKKYSAVNWFGDGDDSEETTIVETLYPCTTEKGITMLKPVYATDTEVSGTDTIDEDEELYYLEKTFYLYLDEGDGSSDNNDTYDVVLAQKVSTSDNTKDGTYFVQTSDGELNPAYCVRMSFHPGLKFEDDTKVRVYEPNYEIHNALGQEGTDYAKNGIKNVVLTTHSQLSSGKFVQKGAETAQTTTTTGDSEALFQISGDTSTPVTIRVWFEGTDVDCRNDIELKNIESQLKFVANKTTTTP